MTTELFQRWIHHVHETVRIKGRKCLLLIDNAPVHKLDGDMQLPFLEVHFLPPNTTAFLQPLDSGIIRSFKAKYRSRLVRFHVDNFEWSRTNKFTLRDAMDNTRQSWEEVTNETIANCWTRTGIVPKPARIGDDSQEPALDDPSQQACIQLQEAIHDLRHCESRSREAATEYMENTSSLVEMTAAQTYLTVEEYLRMETDENADTPVQVFNKEEIVALVLNEQQEMVRRDEEAMERGQMEEEAELVSENSVEAVGLNAEEVSSLYAQLLRHWKAQPGASVSGTQEYQRIQECEKGILSQRQITAYFR